MTKLFEGDFLSITKDQHRVYINTPAVVVKIPPKYFKYFVEDMKKFMEVESMARTKTNKKKSSKKEPVVVQKKTKKSKKK